MSLSTRSSDPEIRISGYSDDPDPFLDPSPEDVRRAAALFKVLSHPDRLTLACRLGDGHETTQKELLEEFDWPQSTMARHLASLREVGLVSAERAGPEVMLRLATPLTDTLLRPVCEWLHGEAVTAGAEPFQGPLSATRRPRGVASTAGSGR